MHESVLAFVKSILTKEEVENKLVVELGSRNINGSIRQHYEASSLDGIELNQVY